jgi:hypothetical protein
LSRSYRVQIAHGPRGQPKVRVLDELATYEERSLPHVYSDGTLCLHEWHEWTATMSIADTIVPWTAEKPRSSVADTVQSALSRRFSAACGG